MCEVAGAPIGQALYPSCSVTKRPHAYQFQISQEQRERETTDRKGISNPPFPLARLTECLHPSHFTEESNYSLGHALVWRRQRATLLQESNVSFLRRRARRTGCHNYHTCHFWRLYLDINLGDYTSLLLFSVTAAPSMAPCYISPPCHRQTGKACH